MSRDALKLFTVAATAAVSGSMALLRKLRPLEAPTCAFCKNTDLYILKDARGMELGQACHGCDARAVWNPDTRRYERVDPAAWHERVAMSTDA